MSSNGPPLRRSRRQRGIRAETDSSTTTSIYSTARIPSICCQTSSARNSSVMNLVRRREYLRSCNASTVSDDDDASNEMPPTSIVRCNMDSPTSNSTTSHIPRNIFMNARARRQPSRSSSSRSSLRDTYSSDDKDPRSSFAPSPQLPPDAALSVAECLQLLNDGATLDHSLASNPSFQKTQMQFLNSLSDRKLKGFAHCPLCKQRWFDTNISFVLGPNRSVQCESCHKSSKQPLITSADGTSVPLRPFTFANNMDPWIRYDHLFLPKLNAIEEMLIALVHPFMRVYRLTGGGMLAYKGNVANLEQDTNHVVSMLP